jgi:hypothetical protein
MPQLPGDSVQPGVTQLKPPALPGDDSGYIPSQCEGLNKNIPSQCEGLKKNIPSQCGGLNENRTPFLCCFRVICFFFVVDLS